MEVTRAYATAPNPFGTVISADGFKMGIIRSQTDYVVFDGILGLRGLDVAFWVRLSPCLGSPSLRECLILFSSPYGTLNFRIYEIVVS
jgi:hypothetical protein